MARSDDNRMAVVFTSITMFGGMVLMLAFAFLTSLSLFLYLSISVYRSGMDLNVRYHAVVKLFTCRYLSHILLFYWLYRLSDVY